MAHSTVAKETSAFAVGSMVSHVVAAMVRGKGATSLESQLGGSCTWAKLGVEDLAGGPGLGLR